MRVGCPATRRALLPLTLPDGELHGGGAVLHDAGSCEEKSPRLRAAVRRPRLAALLFDKRGHGASDRALDGRAIEDVAMIAALLRRDRALLQAEAVSFLLALSATSEPS